MSPRRITCYPPTGLYSCTRACCHLEHGWITDWACRIDKPREPGALSGANDCASTSGGKTDKDGMTGKRASPQAALLAAPVMGSPRVAEVGEGELARIVKLCHNLFLGAVAASMAEISILAQASADQPDGVPRLPEQERGGLPVHPVQDPGVREPRLRADVHFQAAAKGFRSWACSRARARGSDARRRHRPPAHPGTGGA